MILKTTGKGRNEQLWSHLLPVNKTVWIIRLRQAPHSLDGREMQMNYEQVHKRKQMSMHTVLLEVEGCVLGERQLRSEAQKLQTLTFDLVASAWN